MIEVGVIAAVIVGVVEAIKRTGYLSSKWAALVAIVLGVVWFYFMGESPELANRIIEGVITGLTAAGLYSGGKATVS